MISNPPDKKPSRAQELQIFEARIKRLEGSLFAYLGRLGLSSAIAEEVAQEACLKAWRFRHQFDPEKGAYATWLFRIARNLAFTQNQRQVRIVDEANAEKVERASVPDSAVEELERMQLRNRLQNTLMTLSEDDREALSLGCIEELSSVEAAQVLGCRSGTFRTRLARARKRFIKLWEQQSS